MDQTPGKRESPRLRAARYRDAVRNREHPDAADADEATQAMVAIESMDDGDPAGADAEAPPADGSPRILSNDETYEIANRRIDDAVAKGDFDNLAYAGRPIPNLDGASDPDWWLRGLIERENLTGLGPPALLLRTESVQLDGRLDRMFSEREVREALEDFNSRIVEARRQLLGGPPVVTPTRDIEAELRRWHERRTPAPAPVSSAEGDAPASWWKPWWVRVRGTSRRPS